MHGMQLTGHVIIQLSKCSQNSLVLQITNLSVRLHIPTCASINLHWGAASQWELGVP